MTAKYYVTLTDHGATLVAQAHDVASIALTQMVIGDANGVPYDPVNQKSRTALVNQRASVPVQSVTIEGAVTTVTATIPANIGGFNLHEIGLKDNTGQLVYIGNYHGGYKPVIAEGAGGELTIVIDITAESGKSALIEIDPNVVTANKDWVLSKLNPLENFIENIVDYFYPVGVIIDFGIANFDPNDKYVGTTWVRHGEGKTSVGLSTQEDDPDWTKTVGTEFGEYSHPLIIDEMPEHDHEVLEYSGIARAGLPDLLSHITADKNGPSTNRTGSSGSGNPHNNVQPSIVEARWRRTA